jgi:EAL domain-containing protein (putative c-di-GMP-specific phosphodiesterase class I)
LIQSDDDDTMNHSASGGGDLFIGKRGKLARPRGRKTSDRDRPTLSRRASKHAEADADQLRDNREQLIRVTIANRAHETVFQPIVDLRSGGAVGAEALARFAEPPIRPPDVWFAEAASVGLGVELEMAALRLALEQLRHLPSGLYLSLNASVETIMSEDFRASFADVPAERVVLELTEHTEVHDYDLFEQTIEHLRSQGVRLAVDDAGSGYSSFRHILNLRPDVIKLDIGLTRGIDGDPARRALGAALLTFGLDAYNASIVAEGIETEGEFNTLRALGCPFGQGFYLGRPGRLREEGAEEATAEPLWLPRSSTPPPDRRPAGDVPSTDVHGRHSGVGGSPSPTPALADNAVGEDTGSDHGPSKKPRRDDHAELLALVAEIKDREDDKGDRWKRSHVPLKAAATR